MTNFLMMWFIYQGTLFENILYVLPVGEILVLNTYMQKPSFKSHAGLFSGARGLNFGLSLLQPYFVYARSNGSGNSAHLRRLA